MVPPASHRVPRVRWYSGSCLVNILFAYRTITYYGVSSHTLLLKILNQFCSPQPQRYCYLWFGLFPERTRSGLGSFPFARRYLGNRCFFLFLLLLRCFSSEGFLHMAMYLPCSDTVLPYRVSPFGYLRVYGYLLLTAAFRSLSRPSSAPDAKSFSLRSL